MELELKGELFAVTKRSYDSFKADDGNTVPAGTTVEATVLDFDARKVRTVKIPRQWQDSLDLSLDTHVEWVCSVFAQRDRLALTFSRLAE